MDILSANYSKALDETVARLWWELFKDFDAYLFKRACLAVITRNKFFPNASEVISAYKHVKRQAERERMDRIRAKQRLLADGQADCYLCGNSGWCFFVPDGDGYEYAARCVCSHGRDLNEFSEAQIRREHKAETKEHYSGRDNAAIKRGENPFYLPDVREALGDDFAVFDAQRKERHLSKQPVSDEEKLRILKGMGEMVKGIA